MTSSKHVPTMVTTRTPIRVSFSGGGTDQSTFYRLEEGSVISTAINKYLYVTVKKHSVIFEENYRLNYSETEHCNGLDEIKNGIARECLRFTHVDPPLYISTIADLPGSTGLGSSSAFTVGLLNALHLLKGERVSAAQLAEEACHIEIEILKKPIGKQDQYAAAFGGFNQYFFRSNDEVVVAHRHLPKEKLDIIFSSLLLFWTKISRSADPILEEQRKNTVSKMVSLREMAEMNSRLWSTIENGCDMKDFGNILSEGWERKRSLTDSISNPQIDTWYQTGMKAGAYGGKLLGAGGGGFLLFAVPKSAQDAIRAALSDLICIPVQYESQGSQPVYIQY